MSAAAWQDVHWCLKLLSAAGINTGTGGVSAEAGQPVRIEGTQVCLHITFVCQSVRLPSQLDLHSYILASDKAAW